MKIRSKITHWLLIALLVLATDLFAADKRPCYIVVESTGSYERLVVSSIATTMIRQFIDSRVQPEPIGGISTKDCQYLVNVTEKSDGVKVFIFGENISEYATSALRGEAGLEQAFLRTVLKNAKDGNSKSAICTKYGNRLELECVKISAQTPQNDIERKTVDLPNSGPGLFVSSEYRFSIQYPPVWKTSESDKMIDLLAFRTEGDLRSFKVQVHNVGIDDDFQKIQQKRLKRIFKTIKSFGKVRQINIVDREAYNIGTNVPVQKYKLRFMLSRKKFHTGWVLFAKNEKTLVTLILWAKRNSKIYEDVIRSLTFY